MLMIVLETLGTLVIVVLATHAIGWASALSLDDGIEVLRALWIGCVALGKGARTVG